MPKLKSALSLIVWNVLVNTIGKSALIPQKVRYILYKLAGMRTDTANIRSGCVFRGKGLVLEKGVILNHNVFIDSWERVIIKENAGLAFDVMICTSSHKIADTYRRAGESDRKPITIGRGCWVGARATVLPGVTIGDGCMIAAGAVVVNDCEPNGLYAGVPAKRIKDLD
ncbi:acyltransferase [Bacillus spongiae]|uniref:Acyltransferase n=1 Tax=Bacillus spongiae TaxID=2683610 RepID=A0ABU8HDY0_9BACI